MERIKRTTKEKNPSKLKSLRNALNKMVILFASKMRNTKSSIDTKYDSFKQQGGSVSNLLEPKANEWKSPFNKKDSGIDSSTLYDSPP